MTNQQQDNNSAKSSEKGNQPTHVAKLRHGSGEEATYEQIGVAWKNEKGALYIKLHGTQIVSNFTLYEVNAKTDS